MLNRRTIKIDSSILLAVLGGKKVPKIFVDHELKGGGQMLDLGAMYAAAEKEKTEWLKWKAFKKRMWNFICTIFWI